MSQATSRRRFLQAASGLAGTLGARGPLAMQLAGLAAMAAQSSQAADTAGPYRALVCVYFNGGNDSHNWVVPTDPAGYAAYQAARADLAWPLERLQPIGSGGQAAGRSFAMPEELAPIRKWYQTGQAAFVANVGPLMRPMTKADFNAGMALPSKLFSHNDQLSTWQSLWPEGAKSGWGGRMGDLLMSANAYPIFTAVSVTGNAVFLSGSNVNQYQVGPEGPVSVGALSSSSVFGSTSAPAAMARTLARVGAGEPLQAEYVRVLQRGISSNKILSDALQRVSVPAIPATVIPLGVGSSITLNNDGLARQLQMVARMVAAGQGMGMRRQVFMVNMNGFDTHANQMRDQPSLMTRAALSIDYFLSTLASIGMLNNVTLFTASEFGRALMSNGAGCDHGWGSHHLVAGGMVAGSTIHGQFPDLAAGSADDVGSGRLLPSASVTQFAAPLGRWLGLSATELSAVLPGLANFDAQALRFL